MKLIKEIFLSYGVLDSEGKHVNGTDKQTNHNYGDAYESLFPDIRGKPVLGVRLGDIGIPNRASVMLMMEIGIADGSSLLAWSEVFPNARCVGMDIHHSDKAHGERIEFYLGDQRIREDCERAAAGRKFDVIVEDATHSLPNTLLTLFWLWPFVAPGGLYIVEEWENVAGDRERIKSLFPNVEIVGTCGPHIQDEPLVVFRKPI